jgi:hypothetical protein
LARKNKTSQTSKLRNAHTSSGYSFARGQLAVAGAWK